MFFNQLLSNFGCKFAILFVFMIVTNEINYINAIPNTMAKLWRERKSKAGEDLSTVQIEKCIIACGECFSTELVEPNIEDPRQELSLACANYCLEMDHKTATETGILHIDRTNPELKCYLLAKLLKNELTNGN